MNAFCAVLLFVVMSVSGCAYVRPYKIEVNQGNYVTQDAVEKLKAGMSRSQVRTALGPPLIESAFHSNRWEYQFTLERRGEPVTQHRVSVVFEDDKLKSWDTRTLPNVPVVDRNATLPTPESDKGVFGRLRDWWSR